MTDNDILVEVKKAIDLLLDKTYEIKEFYSHILTIIRDASSGVQIESDKHKQQMERLLFVVMQLREDQRLYHGGHKSKLSACKQQEKAIDEKIHYLTTSGGYSVEKYKKSAKQNSFF